MVDVPKSFTDRRLSVTREAEIFQSFVRTNANARALERLEEEALVLLAEELKETKKEEGMVTVDFPYK